MILSKAELSEELGVSPPRISQLVGEGMPCRPDGRVDLEAACQWLVDRGDYGGAVAYKRARDWLFILRNDPRESA
jgi:hypothetical protein